GTTYSTNFPTQNPIQPSFGGGSNDGFVTKINAAGSALVYSTYIGGNDNDYGSDIAVDSSGNAYITGLTQSTNFPTQNPIQPSFGGEYDGFVAKINAVGSALVYSAYLGGLGEDVGSDIAVGSSGNVYITGRTDSTNFPMQNPIQPSFGGGSYDVFVTVVSYKEDRIGVFRGGTWYLDANGDRGWSTGDLIGTFGMSGDLPVAGDWGSPTEQAPDSVQNRFLLNNSVNPGFHAVPGAKLSISGMVFNDLNGEGLRTRNRTGLEGWTLVLKSEGKKDLQTATDDQGQYIFSGLSPGKYTLIQVKKEGWNQTYPGEENYTINLVDTDAFNYDFGNHFGPIPAIEYEYPLMSGDVAIREALEYEKLPKAYIDPDIKAKLAPGFDTASFSLLSYLTYTPSERDQGNCGNCWVWAGTGCTEIDLAVQDGIQDRLSIQYTNSKYNGGSGSGYACCGGGPYEFVSFYNTEGKVIPWSNSNAQWQDGPTGCVGSTTVPWTSISTNPNYQLTSIIATTIPTVGVGQPTAINNIKNVLMQNKPVHFAFWYPTSTAWNSFFSFWNTQPETAIWNPDIACGQSAGTGYGGHAVLCVGWDETTDPSNPCWIMVNSWGTGPSNNRPNGIFRVKMNMNYDCNYPGWTYAYRFYTFDIDWATPPNEEDHIGVFRGGTWYLDANGDRGWSAGDLIGTFGVSGDQPAAGDWNSDGRDEIGVLRGGTWYLDANGDRGWSTGDLIGTFGVSGDKPVAGDWNSDGRDEIGVLRGGTWYLDANGDRAWSAGDLIGTFGMSGDKPAAGDWNGDGKEEIGVLRGGTWYLDANGDRAWSAGDLIGTFGMSGDLPVAGYWGSPTGGLQSVQIETKEVSQSGSVDTEILENNYSSEDIQKLANSVRPTRPERPLRPSG
ncbi:MAG: SBBP repeat-containing protein, partial [Methanotrichaceae archaeon]|nr:SBBP repeat-containing protein [Methanotrichaceae archaeon]